MMHPIIYMGKVIGHWWIGDNNDIECEAVGGMTYPCDSVEDAIAFAINQYKIKTA